MNREIKSNVREEIHVGNIEYEIAYIDITNYTYIKRISERTTHSEVRGLGHIVSHDLFMDEDDVLYYSVIPHNELKSSGVGTVKAFDELDDEELKHCTKLISGFSDLISRGMFSADAIKVFQEFLKKFDKSSIQK